MPQEKGLLVMLTLKKRSEFFKTAAYIPLELQRSNSDTKFFTDVLLDVRPSVALVKYFVFS